jgi:cholesterol oxidase
MAANGGDSGANQEKVWDFVVVGSGFGGSVSALRLAEKGYSVLVLEMGKRFRPEDFAKTNWNLRRFFWAPRLFCHGIQQLTLLHDVLVLHGAGVGGGSLVYANTLMRPHPKAFEDPQWSKLCDWKAVLEPHYAEVARMLGLARNPRLTPADEALREVAAELGAEKSFQPTNVAVYFGEPGKVSPDPYFGGNGPDREGCTFCGGCMVGCRPGAKNTLDKNYLYFAKKLGAVIEHETRARFLEPLDGGGYKLHVERSTAIFNRKRRAIMAKNVVLSGGVLGTVPLLLECRRRGTLTRLSPRLGDVTRTNSEALLGITAWSKKVDHSQGIAITSHFYLEDGTRAEPVRYQKGSDVMTLLGTTLTGGGTRLTRPLKWIFNSVLRPHHFLRALWPLGKARRTIILLLMQTADNRIRLRLRRSLIWPRSFRATSLHAEGHVPIPAYIPIANEIATRLARKLRAVPQSSLNEVLLNAPTTAHILGGCVMGQSPEEGVCDQFGRVFGHEGLFVADGSIIGANLGANPSFTIAALAEHVMSKIAPKVDE